MIPGWSVVIDRPRSVLFAGARRGLFLELALVAAATAIVLFLMGLILLHGRREAERARKRSHQRHELTRILGGAALGSDVSDGLVAGLADAFPGALCIVALETPMALASRSRARPRASSRPPRRRGRSSSSRRRRSPTTRARRS